MEFLKYLQFLGHNFGPRNARKSSKGSKDLHYSLESNEVLSHKIGSLDQPMMSSKKNAKSTPSWCHQPKTPNPKLKF